MNCLCLLRVCERVSEGDGFEVSVRVCVRMSVNDACDRNAMIQSYRVWQIIIKIR